MSENRPKKCTHCSETTSLHVSKVVDGKLHKLSLCAACPQAAKLKEGVGYDLIEEGGSVAALPQAAENGVACPCCGLTPADFKEHGRLGCSACYEVFEEKLAPLFMKLHESSVHLGKAPRARRREASPEKIDALKRRLQELVSREEYELAATVRDQLRSLES